MRKQHVGISTASILLAGFLLVGSTHSFASGFALIEQSASGMGNAFAGGSAIASDASTIYFNPAGMTRVPQQFVGAIHYIKPKARFQGNASGALTQSFDPSGALTGLGGPISGGNGGNASEDGIVPNLYYVHPINNTITMGLGINVPYGLSTKYDNDWKGRYHAIESEVKTVNINPSLAYKVNQQFSLGLGISAQYIDAKLTQSVDQGSLCVGQQLQGGAPPPTAIAGCNAVGLAQMNGNGSSDAFAKVTGDDWSFGFNLGLLYEFSAATRVGMAYRSKIKQKLTGNAHFRNAHPAFTSKGLFVRTNAKADIDLPRTASFSAYHDVNDRWAIMADYTWTEWSSFDELRVRYSSNQPDSVTKENWDSSSRVSAGLSYKPNSSWILRTGVAWDESPIPDNEHRTPRIPGEDRTWLSIGAGYKLNQSLAFDVGYSHLFVNSPSINVDSQTAGSLSGRYEDAKVDIFSAQLVWTL